VVEGKVVPVDADGKVDVAILADAVEACVDMIDLVVENMGMVLL